MTQGRVRTDAENARLRATFGRGAEAPAGVVAPDVVASIVDDVAPPLPRIAPFPEEQPPTSVEEPPVLAPSATRPSVRSRRIAVFVGVAVGAVVAGGLLALTAPREAPPAYVLEPQAADFRSDLPRPDLTDVSVYDLDSVVVFAGDGADGRRCLQLLPVPADPTDLDTLYVSDPTCALAPLHPQIVTWVETPLQNGTILDLPASTALLIQDAGARLHLWRADFSEVLR